MMNTVASSRAPRVAASIAALALAAGCLSAGGVQAQERHDRRHEVVRPYHTPHWVFDNRYHHGHYYPSLGYSVRALPPGYLTLNYARHRLFFQGGVWFEPAGAGFVVVRPPVGVVVPVLPPAYTTVWAAGTPYYYANDVYYASAPGGYAVVNPPPGVAEAAGAPPAPAPVAPPTQASAAPPAQAPGMWYYCESAKAYYPYVGECREPWRQVPATPPR